MITFTHGDLAIIALGIALIATITYCLGCLSGVLVERRRNRPTTYLGDMPNHPESLNCDLDPGEADAWDAITARLIRRRLSILRGRQ